MKKFRKKTFDVINFRRILTKYKVAPILVGGKGYLLKWVDVAIPFGWAILIDYMYEFHDINVYFDKGWTDDKIEHIKQEKPKKEEKKEKEDEVDQTLAALLKEE